MASPGKPLMERSDRACLSSAGISNPSPLKSAPVWSPTATIFAPFAQELCRIGSDVPKALDNNSRSFYLDSFIGRCRLRYDRYAATGSGFATERATQFYGFTRYNARCVSELRAILIHDPSHGLSAGIDASGAGMSCCMPSAKPMREVNFRVRRSSSRTVSPFGSQVMPPLAPPKGTLTSRFPSHQRSQ